MPNYPKFEKVDDYTIRIINEKADEVKLNVLLENKKQIEDKIAQLQQVLKNINDILVNAEKMGITPEEKDKDVQK